MKELNEKLEEISEDILRWFSMLNEKQLDLFLNEIEEVIYPKIREFFKQQKIKFINEKIDMIQIVIETGGIEDMPEDYRGTQETFLYETLKDLQEEKSILEKNENNN